MKILGWYSLIIIIALLATIGEKEGIKRKEVTGLTKLFSVIIYIPTLIYLILNLF